MEWTEETTTMDTDEYTDAERQSMVDHYGTLAIQMILENPWASIPEIMEHMINTGPWSTAGGIVAVFRGRVVFRSMMNRLDIIRGAVLRGEEGELPITTGVPDGSVPSNDPYINWWAPYVQEGGEMYPISVEHMRGELLPRYPHMGVSTEELLMPLEREETEETSTEEEEGNSRNNEPLEGGMEEKPEEQPQDGKEKDQ